MFKLSISEIEEVYTSLDDAIVDCLGIFPDAFFSEWQETDESTWQYIYESYDNRTTIGFIYEI